MCNLHNQALVYIATSNTAIRKSTATPIRATTSTNVERRHEKKHGNSVSFEFDFQFLSKLTFSFFRNRFLKCFYSPLSTLKSAFTVVFFVMYDMP